MADAYLIGESDRWHHQSLAEALLLMAKREGLAGGTVFKGVAGPPWGAEHPERAPRPAGPGAPSGCGLCGAGRGAGRILPGRCAAPAGLGQRAAAPTHAAQDAAAGFAIARLAFRSPELNPCEDVWREMKRVVANRACADVDEQVTRAVAWLDDRSGADNLHTSGLQSSKFDWLPT